jgi:hypothetical protein
MVWSSASGVAAVRGVVAIVVVRHQPGRDLTPRPTPTLIPTTTLTTTLTTTAATPLT